MGGTPTCRNAATCQSGQIMAAAALLEEDPKPTGKDIDEAMTNICRCGTYQRIPRGSPLGRRKEGLTWIAVNSSFTSAAPRAAVSRSAFNLPFSRLSTADAQTAAAAGAEINAWCS